ncbi:MAG: DinB family protein [Actinomycetota bacterium]
MSVEHAPEDPARRVDERTMLCAFVDFYRSVLIRKADGLTADELQRTVTTSSLTIGALVRHMTMVEDYWFNDTFAGLPEREPWASADWEDDPDWEMTTAGGMSFGELRDEFDAACQRSREHVQSASSLDQLAVGGDPDDRCTLRWILIHMLEEYARHCGHADIFRQGIDGRTGD